MATIIRVPSGADTADTLLSKWLKGPGESIGPRSPICELSLEDKRFTVTSPVGGELLYVAGSEGAVLCPGQMLAIVGEPGEKIDSLLAEGREAFTDEPVAFMRKAIAQRLTQ